MRRMRVLLWTLLAVGLSVVVTAVAAAQPADPCPAFVEQTLAAAAANCDGLDRNTACYGAHSVQASFNGAVTNPVQFAAPADQADVLALQRISSRPADPDSGQMGVAFISVQALLPDTVPGQSVIFVLVGDVTVEPDAVGADGVPMQAFRLSSGVGSDTCAEAPNTLLVQAPRNERVTISVNGAAVEVGSTVAFEVREERMFVSTLDGEARMMGGDIVVPRGLACSIPLEANGDAIHGAWSPVDTIPVDQRDTFTALEALDAQAFNYALDAPDDDELALIDEFLDANDDFDDFETLPDLLPEVYGDDADDAADVDDADDAGATVLPPTSAPPPANQGGGDDGGGDDDGGDDDGGDDDGGDD